MAITINNRRIDPYTQKNDMKAIFGDTMVMAFTLPTAHVSGDTYTLGMDYERIVFPTVRPVCALSTDYTISGDTITFTVALNTERLAKWVSTIKKPMPIWIQMVRVRGEVSETLLIDDILAIPSVIDGENTVFPGDPISDLLATKLDAPEEEGNPGQVLKLGQDGKTIWANGGGGGGSVSWDDIEGKPDFATVAETGSYNDLTDKPTIPAAQVQADWSQSNTSAVDYIKHKPNLATVAMTGSYNDLSGKPSLATVATTGDYQDLTNKPSLDFIPTSAKGSAGGVASLNASGLVPDSQITMERPITTIPAATTAYTLYDGIYQHTPSSVPTYTLPAITDTSRTHTVILTVSFANVLSLSFQTAGGTTIAPLDTLTIAANDVAEYLCRYDPLQSAWVIAAGKLNS